MQLTIDAYTPREIAHKIETLGITKARSDTLSLLVLAVLAGAFIALGALFFAVVVTRPALGFGVSRLVGGVAFSLGLILVIIGGAELFTGNNLVAIDCEPVLPAVCLGPGRLWGRTAPGGQRAKSPDRDRREHARGNCPGGRGLLAGLFTPWR
jgi:hypothetical protein